MDENKMVLCKKDFGGIFKKGQLYEIKVKNLNLIMGNDIIVEVKYTDTIIITFYNDHHYNSGHKFNDYFYTIEQTKKILKIKKIKDNYG